MANWSAAPPSATAAGFGRTVASSLGDNQYGQATPPAGSFQQVALAFAHAGAVRSDGSIACWGSNEYGQATPSSGTFHHVAVADNCSCGLKTDTTATC